MWSRNCLPFRCTWFHPRFLVCSCCSIFSFLCNVLYVIVCPFVLFLLANILYVLLGLTASDYNILYVLLGLTASDYNILYVLLRLTVSDYNILYVLLRLTASDYNILYVLFRLTASDYPFSIFKLFLYINVVRSSFLLNISYLLRYDS
jgi:hypothetical protein